ncbi:MAG TPA: tRNA preQ1(34) S-adenosylmethionine ribosyltransferase-isomerase QueA [Planctomycetaceae bacterium]
MDELAGYDYVLSDELVARHPPASRDAARLMIVDRAAGTIRHGLIRDLPELLRAGDCLVLNDTRVVPARLLGRRAATGGKWEGLFLDQTSTGSWRLLCQCRGKLQAQEQIEIHPAHDPISNDRLGLRLIEREDDGIWHARPTEPVDVWQALDRFGTVPLPPYMRREHAEDDDFERYQTVYARHRGSVAAPTAGLHFTPNLLSQCAARGVDCAFVTLHVGIGTFRPIAVEQLDRHVMHSEWCDVGVEAARQLTATQARGGRRIAVGTTTTRALESAAQDGRIESWCGPTDLFIRPPYEFRAIDGLLTNFHLPRSTLLVLVCTFAGRELVLEAYAQAVREKYRFYSYGDAMLVV